MKDTNTAATFDSGQIKDLRDPSLSARLQAKINDKTVPAGALGRLAQLAHDIGMILGTESPELTAPQLLVFAADHGIAARGVSAYPSEVTAQMVHNFINGGAAVSVLARQHGIAQTVIDCGVAQDFDPAPGLLIRKIAHGTKDASVGPAMTQEQCVKAMQNGVELVQNLPGNAVLIGEMGIANTSAATLLVARLAELDVGLITGAGTGLDAAGIQHKTQVLREALQANAGGTQPIDALAALGGFEIATIVGSILQAAAQRRVIVVDGFIASSAILVASRIAPAVLQRCIFAHRSDEQGHGRLLELLQAKPLLDLHMRVGEGSGAALAWPLLVSSCRILNDMASFSSAGVSNKLPDAAPLRAPPTSPQ